MKNFFSFLMFVSLFFSSFAQKSFIRGTVIEEETEETLIGVSVIIQGTTIGTITDLDGQFSIAVNPGIYNIQISYISYQTIFIEDVEVKPAKIETALNDIITPLIQ